MKTKTRRALPVAVALTAGTMLGSVVFPGVTAATFAAPRSAAVTVTQGQHVAINKPVVVQTLTGKAATYATPGGPTSEQTVNIGDSEGRINYWRISSRKLWVDNKDTGWIGRYDVHVRRADGKVVFDRNLSVYKLAWFVNRFKAGTKYADEAALVAALNKAASITEVEARAAFKKNVGSLGEFRTTNGKTEKPYDPSQHPGKPYVPLGYVGG